MRFDDEEVVDHLYARLSAANRTYSTAVQSPPRARRNTPQNGRDVLLNQSNNIVSTLGSQMGEED